MKKKRNIVILCLAVVLLLAFFLTVYFKNKSNTAEEFEQYSGEFFIARPSTSGWLHLKRIRLYDEKNRQVSLRGVSTHGINWFPDYVNQECFDELSKDWNANIVRVALYSDDYCDGDKEAYKELVKNAIEYAINSDMYIIVDWHVLAEKNPNLHINEANAFFFEISKEYGDCPNIIYEICNEPNSGTTWTQIREYANEVISTIRFNSSQSVILVGTPDYCRELDGPLYQPVEDKTNVMYVYHFYTSSHGENMREHLQGMLNSGVPVFISECGIVDSDGEGYYDQKAMDAWFKLVKDNNLPFCMWSLCNKDETASMLKSSVNKKYGFKDSDLTFTGAWLKAYLRGEELPEVKVRTNTELAFNRIKSSVKGKWLFSLYIAICLIVVCIIAFSYCRLFRGTKRKTYNDIASNDEKNSKNAFGKLLIVLSSVLTMVYLVWRVFFSIPTKYGVAAVAFSIILLVIEIWGALDFGAYFMMVLGLNNYTLPYIDDDEYPDVDIFIATYNEPEELLTKTVNGCLHLDYPDKDKVHIYLCDDNRRANIRKLAEKMGVGYFDRPDNKGAKAGNLNNALSKTTSPYIVTLDADMIPRHEFLMKTIPYFIDNVRKNHRREEGDKIKLGLLQTPQAFYTPDVFEHNLYCEHIIPNEQDFFYRTIETAKTSSNSVIYGGSNTVISREALDAIGGFYTESITEDFATGLILEENGFVSLGLSEPLCSGTSPISFTEYIQQRIRWGRGVINSAKSIHIIRNKNLGIMQKISYLSSVSYWYSSIKNLIFLIAPLLFGAFAIPVMDCKGFEVLTFWLPMYLTQSLALRRISGGSLSARRSGIQETCMMPFMVYPIIAETFGKSLKKFKVTNKDGSNATREVSLRKMIPFFVLIALSVWGTIRTVYVFTMVHSIGLLCVLFWLLRNIYYLWMSVYLCDGRPTDGENVKVKYPEFVNGTTGDGTAFSGVTTLMTEHSVSVFLDDEISLKLGQSLDYSIETDRYSVDFSGVVVKVNVRGKRRVYTLEILDYKENELEYYQILYDREPTLPQRIKKDRLYSYDLWYNLTKRLDRDD